MPYRIIKKVKQAVKRPLYRSSDYAMNFGVDLDDENTWRLYPLYRLSLPRIRGKVSQLLSLDGEKLHPVNESFDFEIYCSQIIGSNWKTVETRFLYLPKDLVRGYGIDDNMAIDLLLHEIIYSHWGEETREPLYPKIVKIGSIDIKPKDEKSKEHALKKERSMTFEKKYDVFICHASEDKETFVRGLAEALTREGLEVWFDEFSLSLGDSLRRKIDYGLSNSRYGVVVLSKNFFRKDWPQKELDGLVAKERNFDKVILPIWHGVTREEVESFSPILADRVAVSSNKGIDYIVKEIQKVIR